MGIGARRNKPCDCGSGKKFKKCCIDKSSELIRCEKAINELSKAMSGFKLIPALRRVSVAAYALLGHDGINPNDGKPIPADDFAEIAKRLIINHDESGKEYTHEDHLQSERLVIGAPNYRFISDVPTGKALHSLTRMGFFQHRYYHFMMQLVGRAALLYQFFPELQAKSSQYNLHVEIKNILGLSPAEFMIIGTQALVAIDVNKGIFRKALLEKSKGRKSRKYLTKVNIERFLKECSGTPEEFIVEYEKQKLPDELFGFEFNPLISRPIIQTNSIQDGEDYIVPVAYLLMYKFTAGLFHTILAKYGSDPSSSSSFRDNFGKHIFEPYILRHLREAVSRKLVWPNWPLQYSNKKPEAEIDLLFREEDSWIFIETTLAAASIPVQQVKDDVQFKEYIKRLAKKIKQLKRQHDCFVSGQMVMPDYRNLTKKHHCILVTMEDLPYPNLLIRHFVETELHSQGVESFTYHILHVNEFEVLCDVAKHVGFRKVLESKENLIESFDILNKEMVGKYLASNKMSVKGSTQNFRSKEVPDWSDSIYSDMQEFLEKHYSRDGKPPYSKLLQDSYYRMYAEMGFVKGTWKKLKRKYWPRVKAYTKGY